MAEENESVKAFAPRGNIWAMLRSLVNNDVFVLSTNGVPVDGTSGTYAGLAGPGSLLIDFDNTVLYINSGTKASPTWVATTTLTATLPDGDIFVGDAGNAATPVTLSGDVTITNAGVASVGAVLDGGNLADVANVNVLGGIPEVYRVTCSALTGNVDVTLTRKSRIIDVIAIATAAGGAGDTITVGNGATAITNALDLNVSDKVVVRAGTIDDAAWDIAAAGTLRVAGASGVTCEVIITAIPVA